MKSLIASFQHMTHFWFAFVVGGIGEAKFSKNGQYSRKQNRRECKSIIGRWREALNIKPWKQKDHERGSSDKLQLQWEFAMQLTKINKIYNINKNWQLLCDFFPTKWRLGKWCRLTLERKKKHPVQSWRGSTKWLNLSLSWFATSQMWRTRVQ